MRRAKKPTLAVTLPIPLASVLVIVLAGCQADESAGSAALGDEARTHLRQIASEAPAEVAQGKRRFEQNCSVCHGPAADGTAQGPPLAHKIYEPNHHADAAFTLAVRLGRRSRTGHRLCEVVAATGGNPIELAESSITRFRRNDGSTVGVTVAPDS